MGRGRAKAKQTKVARELKYSSHGTDLDALRAELASSRSDGAAEPANGRTESADDADDAEDDAYADYAGEED
jgi:Protein of unknown function (DUF3073)